jgi:hypothetical protein
MIERQELTGTLDRSAEEGRRRALTPQARFLSRLIEADPDAPVNYLLCGEEWLGCGQFEQARADFEAARTRSERLLSESAWGYIYQSYIDRAEAGLRQCSPGADDQLSEGF